MPAPYDYTYINAKNSLVSPSTVHCRNSALTWYFRRYLLQKAISVFKWKMPVTWDEDFFKYSLYCVGYIAIFKTDVYGVIPNICTLGGYNIFYRPKWAIITNPLIQGIKQLNIDEQCTVIKLQPDYGSIMDLINYYADMLALCAEANGINLVNTKLAYIAATKSKAAAETIKKLYDSVQAGNPLVVFDKDIADGNDLFQLFTQNIGQNFISPDILLCMRKIEQEFLTKIGLPNTNTEKRERLTDDEVNSNNIETQALGDLWLSTINKECEKARNMFNIELSAEWRFKDGYFVNSGLVSVG